MPTIHYKNPVMKRGNAGPEAAVRGSRSGRNPLGVIRKIVQHRISMNNDSALTYVFPVHLFDFDIGEI